MFDVNLDNFFYRDPDFIASYGHTQTWWTKGHDVLINMDTRNMGRNKYREKGCKMQITFISVKVRKYQHLNKHKKYNFGIHSCLFNS